MLPVLRCASKQDKTLTKRELGRGQGSATAGRRAHVYARMRTLCWGALLLYAYLIWDSAARLRYSSGSARTIDVAQTVTSCISFAALLGLSVADCSLCALAHLVFVSSDSL